MAILLFALNFVLVSFGVKINIFKKTTHRNTNNEQESSEDFNYESHARNINYAHTILESFKVFELTADATKQEVMSKYRALCKVYHPDKGGTSEQFLYITKAKDICVTFIKARDGE